MPNDILSASAKGATFLILLQVGSRALTFAVNQVLLRYLSPEILGVSAQLELYSISVLYFARESLRVALQRQASGVQTVVNLAYLAVAFGIPLAYGLASLYLQSETPDVPYFLESVRIYGLATIIELLTEPSFVAVQQNLLYKIRASAETTATLLRCATTCGCAIWANRRSLEIGALPFAAGQMAYALALLVVYTVKLLPIATKEKFSLLPKRIASSKSTEYIFSYFSRPLCNLALSIFLQSSVKYVLTQGDSLLITSLATLSDQGAYALACNYGGLIARMLFQPIEESSRNLFAKLCTSEPQAGSKKDDKSPPKEITQASEIMQDILKFYVLISMVILAAGPTLAPLLLRVVAGSRWADTGAGEVLGTYCYYIPLLAMNGVTEAFVAAVATSSQLHTQSITMGVFFAAFAGSAYTFLKVLKMGAKGLVYANCINMLLRIVWNIKFVSDYFKSRSKPIDLVGILPSSWSVALQALVTTIFMTPPINFKQFGLFMEIGITGGIAAVYGLILLFFERDYIIRSYKKFTSR